MNVWVSTFKYFLKIKLIKYLGNTQTFWRHKFHYKVCIFERPIDIAKDVMKEKNNRDSNKEVSLIELFWGYRYWMCVLFPEHMSSLLLEVRILDFMQLLVLFQRSNVFKMKWKQTFNYYWCSLFKPYLPKFYLKLSKMFLRIMAVLTLDKMMKRLKNLKMLKWMYI